MPKTLLAGLTPLQVTIVTLVFIATLIGAIGLVFAFRWWNGR